MRDYGKVHSCFWSSPTVAAMSDDAKMLALYLMTCQHNTIAGVFRLPDGYVCEDLGWDAERVAEGFAELFANGFATRCATTKWVWIIKHLVWNPPENPNQRKAVAKMALQVPDQCAWKADFSASAGEADANKAEPAATENANPSETLSEPFLNQKQEQKQKKSIGRSAEVVAPAGFTRFWSAWPASPRKVGKGKCLTIWKRKGLEDMADWLVAHVATMKASEQWRKGYDPRPESYLNGEQWPDPSDRDVGGDLAHRASAAPLEFRGML